MKLDKIILAATLAVLTGCADTAASLPSIQFKNPFATSGTTETVKAIYVSQFSDIPIPTEMKSAQAKTQVTKAADGSTIGLETVVGSVEIKSLIPTMQKLMVNQGWSQKGVCSAGQTMLVFEKGSRTAALYLEESPLNTTMQIWVMPHPASGTSYVQTNSSIFAGDTAVRPATASGAVNSTPLKE